MVKPALVQPQSWRNVPILWEGGWPRSGGMDERDDASLQPAPEAACKERERMNGAPTDGATSMGNLGMASPARAARPRSGRRSLRLGEPATWRSATGGQTQTHWLARMGRRISVGVALKRRWSLESVVCDTQHSLAPKKGIVCRAIRAFSSIYRQLRDAKKGKVCLKVRSKA